MQWPGQAAAWWSALQPSAKLEEFLYFALQPVQHSLLLGRAKVLDTGNKQTVGRPMSRQGRCMSLTIINEMLYKLQTGMDPDVHSNLSNCAHHELRQIRQIDMTLSRQTNCNEVYQPVCSPLWHMCCVFIGTLTQQCTLICSTHVRRLPCL